MRVNSEGQGFNAAQATIQFPKEILEVKALDFSASATIFNFWLQTPEFSNSEGKINFIGGTTDGVVGSSIQILKITFIAKGSGEGDVVISDAALTASDGSGTNILSTIETAHFKVSPSVLAPVAAPKLEEVVVTPPTPIKRTPAEAEELPIKPGIVVPLYSDQTKWYNLTTNFLVSWNLPDDISGISTALNKDSNFIPAAKTEGLFDAKIFPALQDGIWYLHLRFKNNIGFGPAAHYRLAIDTVPPLPFEIEALDGLATDNPTPTIQFKTDDGLSGLQNYLVQIDNSDPAILEEGILILPLLPPGHHTVLVKAQDFAGNMRENNIDFEILPIASPTIDFISKDVFVGEGNLMVSGTALSDTQILFYVKDKAGAVVAKTTAKTDENGGWQALVSEPLKKGQYFIEAKAQDKRGALSLVIKSELFKIRPKPLLTIAGVEITQLWFFIGLFILLIGGFLSGWFSYRLWRKQLERKVIIAQRDIVNVYANINSDIDKMLKNYVDKQIDEREAAEMKFILKKMKANLVKTKKYITENIKEISK